MNKFQRWLLKTFFKGMVIYNVDMNWKNSMGLGPTIECRSGDVVHNNYFGNVPVTFRARENKT